MSRVPILQGGVGALDWTLLSNNSCIMELESHIASRNSEFDASAGE